MHVPTHEEIYIQNNLSMLGFKRPSKDRKFSYKIRNVFPTNRKSYTLQFSFPDEIEMDDGKLQSSAVKTNLKEVEDKLAQLIREVNKLQEQVAVISSQGNGTYNTTHM